ncbi:MAG: hypothetical protein IIC02_04200 [Planctomycetes bacterium]|nr:hypothetical protein [Planctomycetota bacterium]
MAWANLFARGHPIADTGKLSLAHATQRKPSIELWRSTSAAIRLSLRVCHGFRPQV